MCPQSSAAGASVAARRRISPDRRDDRASIYAAVSRSVSTRCSGRHLLVSRLRPRRQDVAARRARAPRGVRRARVCRPRWSGAVPASGAHVWVFFSAPVAAASARRLGALLLRDAMSRRGELDLASYDRLFPNQDFLPAEGVREPDRAAAPGPMPRGRNERLPRPGDIRACGLTSGRLLELARTAATRTARSSARRAATTSPVGAGCDRRHAADAARDERLPAEISCTIGADLAIPRGEPAAVTSCRAQAPRLDP